MGILRFVLGVALAMSCGIGDLAAQPASTLAESNNQFAFDLYQRYAVKEGNVFFSPYSLSTALGMTYEGARGKTADEMRAVLHFTEDDVIRRSEVATMIERMNRPDKPFELTTANALWAQMDYAFEGSYLQLIKRTYSGEARNLDFAADTDNARLTINAWVMEQTRDRIKDLLPDGSLSPLTRMVLTNAVYFKGKWQDAFDKALTKPAPFWSSTEMVKDVVTMHKVADFFYSDDDVAQILQIPYKGNELSMVVILPKDKTIKALEGKLSSGQLRAWLDQMSAQKVDVSLPSFEFDAGSELSGDLQALGMASAFSGAADFSGMTGTRDLLIGGVFHKAWVKVDEEGTEAAAATAVVMERSEGRPLSVPKIFRADHPFVFIIQETSTGHILFMGRVSAPEAK